VKEIRAPATTANHGSLPQQSMTTVTAQTALKSTHISMLQTSLKAQERINVRAVVNERVGHSSEICSLDL